MVAAIKIKIIDEDAQNKAPGLNKKSVKVPKKKVVKKAETKKKIVRKAPAKKKVLKKKAIVSKDEIKIDALDLKKKEIKKDIFANIDSVKKIVEEETAHDEKQETLKKVNKGQKDRETVIENLNNNDGSSGAEVSSNLVDKMEDRSSDAEAMEDRPSDAEAMEDRSDDEYLETNHNNKSLNLYKKIAYFFIFLVLILVLVVLYFSFVRVKIILIPNQEKISNNMIFDIRDKEKGEVEGSIIPGAIREEAIESSDVFEASGTEVIGKEAVGEITIINNYSQNQPLVASTRMIPVNNPDKLFRLKETVNIPAGGEIKAEIYADDPSPEMAIKPTRFTIPGLWAGLQDKIYAESENDIVYRQKVKKYIVESDFDDGKVHIYSIFEQFFYSSYIYVHPHFSKIPYPCGLFQIS